MKLSGRTFIVLWLSYSILLIIMRWNNIVTHTGDDTDDTLRMVQLRDFLNGQSWFDVTQYRMNAPQGAPMHWSRLIELPLAFFVLLFTPIFGQPVAEMISSTIVPLITMGIAVYSIAQVTAKLASPQAAMVAVIIAFSSIGFMTQFRPMRIDHHGWQIAMACVSLYTVMWRNKKRAGIAMGLAMAIWTHISLEGLPLTAAFFVLLGWHWVFGKSESRQLFWAISSFVLGSFALFLGTQTHGLLAPVYCDTISTPHIAAIVCAAAIMLPAIYSAPEDWRIRLVVAIVAGAAAAATLLLLAPQCANGAFGSLDPIVRTYWFENISEGLPIWDLGWEEFLILYTAPLLSIILAFILWQRGMIARTTEMSAMIFFMLCSFGMSLFVFRAISLASIFAVPLIAIAITTFFQFYRDSKVPFHRIGLVALMLFISAPGIFSILIYTIVESKPDTAITKANEKADVENTICESVESIAALAKLPISRIDVPLDLGPMVLLTTPHSVLASNHHRNQMAMRDHIQIYRLAPQLSREIIRRHGINYIAICPNTAEMTLYEKNDRRGLWATLKSGHKLDWIERLPDMGKGIHVWRVKPNLKDT